MSRLDIVPPVEPIQTPATEKTPQRAGRRTTTPVVAVEQAAGGVIAGDSLRPAPTKAVTEAAFWYWCGVTDACAPEAVALAGETFSRRTEDLLPTEPGSPPARELRRGQVLALTVRQLHAIAEQLGRAVLRPTNMRWASGRDGAVPLVYSSAAERAAIDEAKRAGLFIPTCEPREGDLPLADFVYMQRLDVAEYPGGRSATAKEPPPVSQTGIELPDASTPPAVFAARAAR